MVFNQLTIIIIFILSMFLLATIESLIVFPQSRTLFRFRGCHSWDSYPTLARFEESQ